MVRKTKSALSYFGSDSEVAAQLGAMLDGCTHVTVPFVGGASILPYLTARAIVANDKNNLAINFYKVLSDEFKTSDELRHLCEKTLSHPSEIEYAQRLIETSERAGYRFTDPTMLAWAYWAICWIGRKGKGGTKHMGGMSSIRRTGEGGTNATRIRSAAKDLGDWAKQFERCEWESVDFREILPKVEDIATNGVYCDPPFIGAGANYLHPFSEDDHRDLNELLSRFEMATVVVRYGDHPSIRELYSDWEIVDGSSRDQCNAMKGEIWICKRSASQSSLERHPLLNQIP